MQSVFRLASRQKSSRYSHRMIRDAELKTDWTKPPDAAGAMGIESSLTRVGALARVLFWDRSTQWQAVRSITAVGSAHSGRHRAYHYCNRCLQRMHARWRLASRKQSAC